MLPKFLLLLHIHPWKLLFLKGKKKKKKNLLTAIEIKIRYLKMWPLILHHASVKTSPLWAPRLIYTRGHPTVHGRTLESFSHFHQHLLQLFQIVMLFLQHIYGWHILINVYSWHHYSSKHTLCSKCYCFILYKQLYFLFPFVFLQI